jgi:MazG family protein
MTASRSPSGAVPGEAAAPARPLDPLPSCGEPRTDALRRLVSIVDRLRAPDGCPWDREQTDQTVAPHLVEEAHELREAVELGGQDAVIEEAGDLLMGVVLLARIAEQAGRFDLAQVAEAVSDKLVRRHPHVFGEAQADSAASALANWEAIKRSERAAKAAEGNGDKSALAGVPGALPALQRAARLGQKAVSAGFRWADDRGAFEKLLEEVGELEQAMRESVPRGAKNVRPEGPARERLEHELGDVLVAAAFLGNYLGLDPEGAARAALRRFERRFREMESSLGRPLSECSLERMMEAWRSAKLREGSG